MSDLSQRSGAPARGPVIRVALEVRSLDRGGLETMVAELARGLPAWGVEPVVVCTESGGAIADLLRREGVPVEVLTGDHRDEEMRQVLLRHRVRLLNAHFSSLGTAVASALGIPVVVTLHNAYAWVGAELWSAIRSVDPHVSAYVAVSASVADFSAKRFQIDPERIAVIRNGARMSMPSGEPDERARLRAELGIDAETDLVVQIGAVSRVKCQLAVVDAVARLRETRPRLVAWLVGPVLEEDYGEAVRRRIAESGLQDRVALVGPRNDVPRLLGAADLFVLPSVIEGLSLAAVEALLAGVPTVLTRTGDAEVLLGDPPEVGEIVEGPAVDPWTIDGESLREIAGAEHPVHAEALARAIDRVLADLSSQRIRARARGIALAGELTPEAMCSATASLLLRVAASTYDRAAGRAGIALSESIAREAEIRPRLERLASEVERLHDETRRGIADLRARIEAAEGAIEAAASRGLELQSRTLDVATRIFEKLRITRRVKSALRAATSRLAPNRGRHGAGRVVIAPQERQPSPHPVAPPPAGRRRVRWVVLAVVPIDDIGGAQRSARLAHALAARGDRVSYAARFPRAESVDLGLRAEVAGLEVLAWDSQALRSRISDPDERVLVVVEVPDAESLELARFAREHGARVIYDKVDAWEACTFATWFQPEVERELIAVADDLVGSARSLVSQLESSGRRAHLVPNAVDRRLFDPTVAAAEPPPADLVRGEVTLVYAGSLWGEWFDWNTLAAVAHARPTWQINLIGDRPTGIPIELPPNVHLLGLKPQSALPPYYRDADVCLIPFSPSPLVDAVNPLKVYEYLAMRRPVVATEMPELRGLPFTFTGNDRDSTIAAVERATATPAPLADLETFLEGNTWEARVEALAAVVRRPTIAVVVLCFNNADVIGTCVDSLTRFRGDANYVVTVVDNGSTDGSLEILVERERRGEIRLLRNTRNGCSSGRNLGLAETRSEIVVFLDSDQWAQREGWLEPALDILGAHREIGAVAWNAGWFDPGSGRGPIVDYFPERAMTGLHAGAPFRTDVAYLATSGFVAPRAILARTRGFDEFYDPTCFEDTDLSFQIKALGYALAYCPAIGVGHRPHQTTGSLRDYDDLIERNERYFLEKWSGRPDFFLRVPASG